MQADNYVACVACIVWHDRSDSETITNAHYTENV